MKASLGFISSFLIFVLTGFVRSYFGFKADYYITSSLYFLLTIAIIKLFKVQNVKRFCLYEAFAIIILFIIDSFVDFLFGGGPLELIPYLLMRPNLAYYFYGIFLAYCFVRYSKRRILITLLFALPMFIYWFYAPYLFRYGNFGTYTSNVSESVTAGLVVYDEKGQPYKIESKEGKYLVLDFWFKGCGPCYRAFPKLEQLFQAQKGRMDVMCINHPVENNGNSKFDPFADMRSRGYTFPVFKADTSLAGKFNVLTFPTVLVIKDNKIVFRGNIEDMNDRFKFF